MLHLPQLPVYINDNPDAALGEICNLPRGDIAVIVPGLPPGRAVASGQVWVTIAQADAAQRYGWKETGVTDGYLTVIQR